MVGEGSAFQEPVEQTGSSWDAEQTEEGFKVTDCLWRQQQRHKLPKLLHQNKANTAKTIAYNPPHKKANCLMIMFVLLNKK